VVVLSRFDFLSSKTPDLNQLTRDALALQEAHDSTLEGERCSFPGGIWMVNTGTDILLKSSLSYSGLESSVEEKNGFPKRQIFELLFPWPKRRCS